VNLAPLLLLALLAFPLWAAPEPETPATGQAVPSEIASPSKVLVPEGEAYKLINPLLEKLNADFRRSNQHLFQGTWNRSSQQHAKCYLK
jgi:hypothetical protein